MEKLTLGSFTRSGQIVLLDMHNNPAFAVEQIQRCVRRGLQLVTTKESLEGFIAKATSGQRAIYELFKDKILIFDNSN